MNADKWLKKLGQGWSKVEATEPTYVFVLDATESLKVIKVSDGWVCLRVLNGRPNFGHHHETFKSLLSALNG